jgi:hypothetical protein
MNDYINPAREQIGRALRRGGPMDMLKFTFVCQQCDKRITLTLRQVQRGAKPVCKICGPAATMLLAERSGYAKTGII